MRKYFVDGVQNKLNKGSFPILRWWLRFPLKSSILPIEVIISPKYVLKNMNLNIRKFLVIFSRHQFQTKDKSILSSSKDNIIENWWYFVIIIHTQLLCTFMEDSINLFKGMFQFKIGILWRNFHLDDESIYFVYHYNYR